MRRGAEANEVGAARAAASRGDDAAALAQLLAAWRRTRHPRVAELVGKLGAQVARGRVLPKAKRKGGGDAAWLALAAGSDPGDVDVLLATIGEVDRPGDRFAALLARGPDPRVATAIVKVLAATYHGRFAPWRPLFVGLATAGDPRVRDRLAEIRRVWLDGIAAWSKSHRVPVERGVETCLAAARTTLAAIRVRAPSAAEAADLDAIDAQLAGAATAARDPATEAALLGAIYADPASDGPRAIYADWLIERGDPRGEFIVLQLTGKDRERTANLEREHGRAWLGGLAACCSEVTFARGFPATAQLEQAPTAPDPAWRTIEEVGWQLPASDANPMPCLKRVTCVDADALVALAAMKRPPPIETLQVFVPNDAPPSRAVLAALATLRLPALRELDLGIAWPDPVAAIALLCAIGPIERLAIASGVASLAAWLPAARDTTIATLVTDDGVTCTRKGRAISRLDCHRARGDALDELAALLLAMPAGSITDVTAAPTKAWWTSARRQRMTAALARHPKLSPAGLYGFTPTRAR